MDGLFTAKSNTAAADSRFCFGVRHGCPNLLRARGRFLPTLERSVRTFARPPQGVQVWAGGVSVPLEAAWGGMVGGDMVCVISVCNM